LPGFAPDAKCLVPDLTIPLANYLGPTEGCSEAFVRPVQPRNILLALAYCSYSRVCQSAEGEGFIEVRIAVDTTRLLPLRMSAHQQHRDIAVGRTLSQLEASHIWQHRVDQSEIAGQLVQDLGCHLAARSTIDCRTECFSKASRQDFGYVGIRVNNEELHLTPYGLDHSTVLVRQKAILSTKHSCLGRDDLGRANMNFVLQAVTRLLAN
jgi:hypothetical protein